MLSSFLNNVIRFALTNRMLVAAWAVALLLMGAWKIPELPIDVFPDLNRPRVVIMTEAHGLAPEEVETFVSLPIETALNGAAGVQDVRSASGVGLSVVYVEFDWGTDIYTDRQVVAERLATVDEQLPEGVRPNLAPVSSIMGQIVMLGMLSETSDATRLARWQSRTGDADAAIIDLNGGVVPERILEKIASSQNAGKLSNAGRTSNARNFRVTTEIRDTKWLLQDQSQDRWYAVVADETGNLELHRRTSPMEMRTLADWVVRQQILTIPGVAQVFVMGGDRKQFQVLADPTLMLKYGVTLHEIEDALARSNENATGGYLDDQGPNELLVRVLGRVGTLKELNQIVVKGNAGKPILLNQVAAVTAGAQVKRGDSAVYQRQGAGNEARWVGGPGIVMTVNKQPGADTRKVTNRIDELVETLQGRLGDDIRIETKIYQQKQFIDLAIENVIEALRDGGLLVVVILFLFLLNFRTTIITLTAIPLSIVVTALVFWMFGFSINTMTLGGLAVAIGELVDDAIVDVENVFRRLKENRRLAQPKNALLVVFQASAEIRNSIVFGTMIVILVFLPVFALTGMAGKLFVPLGVAYIVSILSSLVVSLTVTPVLGYWLLRGQRTESDEGEGEGEGEIEFDSFLLRFLKWGAGGLIRFSIKAARPILFVATLLVILAAVVLMAIDQTFLPPFNEGAVQVNVFMPPGTSLDRSSQIASSAGNLIRAVPEVVTLSRRTGRAELDEHAEGVNVTEFIASTKDSARSREAVLADIRERLDEVPGIQVSVEQPLAHLISHMISGVKAQIGIKLYGDDLDKLRRYARRIEAAVEQVPGTVDAQVEQLTEIPQLRIEVLGDQLPQYGLTRGDVTELIETAMNGKVVSEIIEGQRRYELVVRLAESAREDVAGLGRLSINLPDGGTTKLENVARVYESSGPNEVKREKVRRRIVIQCNVAGRGLVDVVQEVKERVGKIEAELPVGYFVEYSGQFESEQKASRIIAILFAVSLLGMLFLLYTIFGNFNLALQVMVALPMAFVGSVLALLITGQMLSIAAKIGFISLCGIASRNGILLMNHYLHLVKHEGETWSKEMIVRAGKERLAPVLMTALTSGIGLVPLAMAAGETGKEILYPVATVIIGGLISSTLLEFLVRPALFWQFGLEAAKRAVEEKADAVELVEEGET